MPMSDPRELFLHELGDVLYAENVQVKTLATLAKEASDDELRALFEEHLEETRGQVDNVKRVFALIGEKPSAEKCPGIEGITAEHDEFTSEEDPSPPILDVFLTGAGARAEHYEIAAYTGLIATARALKEREAVQVLQENLRQEKEALKKLESAAKRLAKEATAVAA